MRCAAVTEKLYHHAQQGGAKVVWLPDAAQLTEAAANALLKTLEEPPKNTWFLLCSRNLRDCWRRCAAAALTVTLLHRMRRKALTGC